MRTRYRNPFTTVRTAGLLLPVDLLARLVDADRNIPGLTPEDYHLAAGERLSEAASRAWSRCLAHWQLFRSAAAKLPASDQGTTLTRDRWLLVLFQDLGYGRLQPQKAIEIEEKSYPISHGWGNHVPIHLVSFRHELDRRASRATGAASRSPYSLVQELLNRSAQHRWGFVSNGRKFYVLRDNASLARAANVEFDLESMFDGEVYSDFLLLFLVCHQSRLEVPADGKPEDCWLEKWSNLADEQGTRAREQLRDGVENAIKALGAGFLTTAGNESLRDQLRSGEFSTQDYYRELLRIVYRLLLLLVAEEKKSEDGHNLFHPPTTPGEIRERYARYYSIGRLRNLAMNRRGTAHVDLYDSLKVLFVKLRTGYVPLGIPGLGAFLFSDHATPHLDIARLSNEALLDAIRELCITEDTSGRGGSVRRPVDFANLGSEELGSIYESLLELHPKIETNEGPFILSSAAGNERKTTGSYYTPRSLINCLLDSALDPVVADAINKPDREAAEEALLNLKVCDPACGSGHFLIAASDRMARHLATLRGGEEEPTARDVQHAKRDIIGRCIYGVDLNPMAVELCKVSLWMEALEPGKPLSFLDHHIKCGNSLLGTTPALLANGIPDEAFKAIAGDDKSVCTQLKKDNKQERKDYERGYRVFHFIYELGNMPAEFARLATAGDDSVADVDAKARHYAELIEGLSYRNAWQLADAWSAVFGWKKDKSDLGQLCPTERNFRTLQSSPDSILPHVREEIRRLSQQERYFHWHLSFPDVFQIVAPDATPENNHCGWSGGFDTILGNPPWDKIQPEEEKFFASVRPDIAFATNGKERKELIADLPNSDPLSHRLWVEHKRSIEGQSHFLKSSGGFALSSQGNLNTYRLFTELASMLMNVRGRAGIIVQSGLATDESGKELFDHLLSEKRLERFLDFENRQSFFPEVDSRFRFCLLTIRGSAYSSHSERAEFGWLLQSLDDLTESGRLIALSAADLRLFNPTSRTCPVFTSLRSFEFTRSAYLITQHVYTSADDRIGQIDFLGELFNLTRDQKHFTTSAQEKDFDAFPLYEAKFIHQFDHRFATVKDAKVVDTPLVYKEDAAFSTVPQKIVSAPEVNDRLCKRGITTEWLFGFRDIASGTNERTAIASVFPKSAVKNSINLILGLSPREECLFLANVNAFAFDYFCRQKVGGTHVNIWIFKQLPAVRFDNYEHQCEWSECELGAWLTRRVLELACTGWDMEMFARACNYDGPPFRWQEERRFLARCEIDAAYFHLYGIKRDDVDYIMETFPILKRKDKQEHGEYRTKNTILHIYDQMVEAIRTSQSYQTALDPPPGPPTDAEGNFIPFSQWDDAIRTRYENVIHSPKSSPIAQTSVIVDPAFPSLLRDKLLCGALLDLASAAPGLKPDAYLDILGLATNVHRCGTLLLGNDRTAFNTAKTRVPAELTSASNASLPWREIRSTLCANRSLVDSAGVFTVGDNCANVRRTYPALDAEYFSLVIKAAARLRELQESTVPLDADDDKVVQEVANWRGNVVTR